MRSTGGRLALAGAAIAAVVILFVVLSGGDDNNSSNGKTTTSTTGSGTPTQVAAPSVVVVKDGKPDGGIKKLEYTKGDQVRLVVRSDVADEIHVHGYDLKKDVPAGG